MEPITTTSKLADACTRLAQHPFVTVDTEFLRESTYYPQLCVAQMASAGETVVIDALAQGIDLAPFFALMADKNVIKVFHAARQDIEICWHEAGIIPQPLIDTQVAAMVLGYGDSISYDQLVQRITGDSLDKSNRFTDWTRRPLSEAQLAYAVSDVTHLRDVYLALAADLDKRGRSDWMREEMRVLTSPATYRFEPEHAWERLKTRVRKPRELAVLIEVAAWREREARSATCRAAACSRTTSSAISRCRRRPRSSGSRACARCRRASSGRNGARRSWRRFSAGWRAIIRRCHGSSAPNRR
jgi:ribonuclease D